MQRSLRSASSSLLSAVGKLTEQVHLVCWGEHSPWIEGTGIPVHETWDGQEGLSGGHGTPLACLPVARPTRAGRGGCLKAPGWGLGRGHACVHLGWGAHGTVLGHCFLILTMIPSAEL